jgi:hypothetical protein
MQRDLDPCPIMCTKSTQVACKRYEHFSALFQLHATNNKGELIFHSTRTLGAASGILPSRAIHYISTVRACPTSAQ